MSLSEIDLYQKAGKVGEGTYGVVYKATNRRTGDVVALKRIRLDNDEEGLPCTAIRWVLLGLWAHPRVEESFVYLSAKIDGSIPRGRG